MYAAAGTWAGDAAQPSMLTSLRQGLFRIASIAVRTRGDADAFAPRLDAIMRSIDADTPLYWIRDYTAVMRNTDVDKPRNLAKSVTVE